MLEEMKTAILESTKKILQTDANWFSEDQDNGAIFAKTHDGLGVSVFCIDVMEDYTCVRIPVNKLKGLRDYLNTVLEAEESNNKQEEE